jgi:protein-tyrosine sulfotransferase
MATDAGQAIFVIGIEHRSGTNFLSDLLALHADCCRPSTIGEDFLLHNAQHLERYAAGLHASWNPEWRQSASQQEIGAALGRGLLRILTDQADRPALHLVTKTPRADRLGLFPWLFPDQPLLILIRDGRSLVESAVKSFGWTYRKAIERWSRGARRILEFDRDERRGACRYLVVRYEDLVTDLTAELHRILAFLRLDPRGYDFDAAAAMPVRGSSVLKSQGHALHWKPVPKSSNFDPLRRASNWTARDHRRFLQAAGMYQQLLGYSVEGIQQPGILGGLWSRWLQRKWQRRTARLGLVPLARQVIGPQLAEIEPAEEQPLVRKVRRAA